MPLATAAAAVWVWYASIAPAASCTAPRIVTKVAAKTPNAKALSRIKGSMSTRSEKSPPNRVSMLFKLELTLLISPAKIVIIFANCSNTAFIAGASVVTSGCSA